ncbi:MAG TPA: carboxymuconolactone decarboxylase family protein [Thermoanaerobaculia bacterium]|nr:carboxymuconolactone decarboxylase family protein [Thermoanaerobaculia bacterium]
MSSYAIHTLESAPDGSKPLLAGLRKNLGLIPNLAAAMAESPTLLKGFLALREIYRQGTLSEAEIEVLSLTAAYENDCAWCVAFHSMMASKVGVAPQSIEALRGGLPPLEPRLAALSDFAREMVRARGAVSPDGLARFLAAGLSRAQALEVVLGMGFSVLANYAGHLVEAPLNEPMKPFAWRKAA